MSTADLSESAFSDYSCADGVNISPNSVTTDYWVSSSGDTEIAALATAVITLCFFIAGIPSNLLIVLRILTKHLYKEPNYIILLNLATTDLLLCVLVMPFTIISGFAGEFVFGQSDSARCKVCQLGLFFTLLAMLTIHNVVLLSVDRFIFIKYPLKYHKIVTVRRVTATVIGVWIWSLFASTVPLFGFGDFGYSPSISVCLIKFSGKTELSPNIYYPVFLALVTLVSLFILFFFTIWVGCIVQKHIQAVYSTNENISSNEGEFVMEIRSKLARTKHMKEVQLVKVFGAILGSNIITFIPLVVRVFYSAASQKNTPSWSMVVVYTSVISIAIIHPSIQVMVVPEFRKCLTYCYCRRSVAESSDGG